jgi:hypothetical protein
MKEFIKDIPGWAKGVAIIVVIGIIAFVVYKFYKDFKPRTQEQKDLEKDQDTFVNQGQKPSFPRSQYKAFADTIQQENLSWDTDEEKIYGIFKQMKNDLDITLLVEAFGERRPQFTVNTGMALAPFLNEDLSKSEMQKINNILISKNIKFRF